MDDKMTGFQSVDEYVATLPAETQKRLAQLRTTVKAVVPEAKEKISYQIGAFELHGKHLIYFAGWKNHISVYPIPAGDAAFNELVAPYADGKGTLKFPLQEPFPVAVINQIVMQAVKNMRNG